ncbi:MAG: MraY family glycosyltransferase [Limnochordales bacterium]
MGNTLAVFDLFFIAIVALGATWLLTPWVRRLAFRVGLVDKPGPRRLHQQAMATGGGLAIFGGFWLAMFVVRGWDADTAGLFAASLLMVALGVVDDFLDLRPGVKLAGQIAAATVFVALGQRIETLSLPLGGVVELGWLSGPATVFWLVAVTNALNIIDGLDGLAAGVAGIAAVPLLVMCAQQGEWPAALAAAALLGSTLAFLRFNFSPAQLFMGDTGGMFLGFVLGAIVVQGVLGSMAPVAASIPVLVLGLPIFDTACAIIRRAAAGRPIAQADDGHLHHRLLQAGLSQRQAVLRLYGVGALLAVIGWALLRATPLHAFLVAGGIAAAAFPWAWRLGVLTYGEPTAAVEARVRQPLPGGGQRSEKA